MPSTTQQPVIHLPDILRNWPWPRTISPYYEDCKRESEAWLASFHAFSHKAQTAFNMCNFSLLSCLAWANLNREGCRIGCDLMHLFFVFDEHSDRSTEEETRQQAHAIMDALRNPHKPRLPHEFIGGRIAQQYWLNAMKSTPASFHRRFIESFQRYTDAVVQQSSDRDGDCQRDLQSYLSLRRDTIGTEASYVLNAMHMDLPDHVWSHAAIKRLEHLATDMIVVGNDIASYDREQSQPGQAEHNIISVVMASFGLSVQGAMDWAGEFHDGLVDEFLTEHKRLPVFAEESEETNQHVREYAHALGNWVRAPDSWGFESERYFGKDAPRVGRERTIVLRPQQPLGDQAEAAIAPAPITVTQTGMETVLSASA